MDSVLIEAERLFLQRDYEEAVVTISQAQPLEDWEGQSERTRLLAWSQLARGETAEAYELFWSCAHHPGARAGILLLTVLAGQVETAMGNWVRHCDRLTQPPSALPDAKWHSSRVVKPALQILERYPFRERSAQKGAGAIYQALLHQTQGDDPGTFRALAQVTDYYTPARLLRDQWMDELLCLPLPKKMRESGEPWKDTSQKDTIFPGKEPEDAVAQAAQILLYPDIESLESMCDKALAEKRFLDALEALRRLLFLDPQHTSSLEKRWRLYLKLQDREAAKQDLFYLMDVYERDKQILACRKVAETAVATFPEDERALLKMCFLQARLGATTVLALYGKRLLELCHRQGHHDRGNGYRRWLLRQRLSLDDRTDFEAS